MIFKYTVEIEVDENNIEEKYPNYQFNYCSPQELADSVAYSLEIEGDTDMRKNGLDLFGYSIKVDAKITNNLTS